MLLLKRIVVHPATVCILFCFIIISGEATGYFYLTLLMLGLSNGLLHSILGIGGLLIILFSIKKRETYFTFVLKTVRFNLPGFIVNQIFYPTRWKLQL